jgi:hypothetical protein
MTLWSRAQVFLRADLAGINADTEKPCPRGAFSSIPGAHNFRIMTKSHCTGRSELRPAMAKETPIYSLAGRASLLWAVCSVANPRHSGAMAVASLANPALQPIPNQGARPRGE